MSPLIHDPETGRYAVVDYDHHVIRKHFRRVHPQGDAADEVKVVGLHRDWNDEFDEPTGGVVVQCLEFGAVPDASGWASPTEVIDLEEFAETYERFEPSRTEAALQAAEATAEAEARRIDIEAQHLAAVNARAAQIAKEAER